MDFETLAITLVGAVIGGLLGYLLALRAARQQRRHEIRERAYSEMEPIVEDLIIALGYLYKFQQVDITNEREFPMNEMLGAATSLGDADTVYALDLLKAKLHDTTGAAGEKIRSEIVDRMHSSLFLSVYRGHREFRHQSASLRYMPPTAPVQTQINELQALTTADEAIILMQELEKLQKPKPSPSTIDEGARVKRYKATLDALRDAIEAELKKT